MARTRTIRGRRARTAAGATLAAGVLLAASGCGAADMTKQSSPFAPPADVKTVTLSQQSWVGSQSNVAVAKKLLEDELGYRVDVVQTDEVPAWDALSQGRVDAIMEDWGHPEQEQLYIEDKGTIERAGDLGVTGHIGWFVPKYWADKHPDVTDWKNLDKYADQLRTPESGDKGQLMDGSPSFITNDQALVKNLDLDYEVVFAGSEAAQISQMRQSAKTEKPYLTYWYKPHWLFEEIPMDEVELPEYTEECAAKAPEDIDCEYPTTPLQKFLNADFVQRGGEAVEFLQNFRWTEKDQNEVSQLIAAEKLAPEEAAQRWIEDNPDVWRKWLPKS
ncbi:ABC transporter substrate-binding protein [Streptomyces lycii]|uniref:ABC transporter substrate-binding protein n=1 Tax=Streptomyces lycii TaxID=2654337 RepID=A0ABQ7FJY3_9ACTN|nr:ABC transporter substrate-binding protein [Streptomyces lycii]KAF4409291.1 ABC transporter substrate-binding protein [Streptomyces lycii]